MTASDSKTKVKEFDLDDFEDFEQVSDNVLKLSDLTAREQLPFELADGTRIYFVDPTEFSPGQNANFSKAVKFIYKQVDLLEKSPNDTALASRLDKNMGKFLKMILPDFPDDQLDDLTYGHKSQIILWWATNTDFGGTNSKKM